MDTLTAYRKHMLDIARLGSANSLLGWDLETHMPAKAIRFRSEVIGLLSKMMFERFTSDEVGAWISELSARDDLSFEESASVRVVGRDYHRRKKLPAELVEQHAIARAQAQPAWAEARQKSDFNLFLPHLVKMIDFAKRIADCYGYEGEPYDALLEDYEPGMNTTKLRAIIAPLRDELVPFIKRLTEDGTAPDTSFLQGEFDPDTQKALAYRALDLVGYDHERGALGEVAHPFCVGISPNDVRVNNRYPADRLESGLFGALHEGGHAMYGQGMPESLYGLHLSDGASNGFHESQSRMIENQVGRSRPFWRFFQPTLAEFFPRFADTDPESLYRAMNVVTPSFIRVEADEVTYNFHIMLRLEIETGLVNGTIDPNDLPRLWNEAMEKYLGIVPPNDALGVLQDVHWSMGYVGYFPSYMLGNLYAAQLFATMREALPSLDTQIEQGDFEPLLAWLRENVHQYGAAYEPEELITKITGRPLDGSFFARYVTEKYSDIYRL